MLKKNSYFLFRYASWCEHCKNIAEPFMEAAEKVGTELKLPVKFADIESATIAENKALADK